MSNVTYPKTTLRSALEVPPKRAVLIRNPLRRTTSKNVLGCVASENQFL
jgi:hypothetical protein